MDINKLISPKKQKYDRAGRPTRRPDAVKLLTQYQDNTADELAKLYKVAPSTIRRWIRDARQQLKENHHDTTKQQAIHD